MFKILVKFTLSFWGEEVDLSRLSLMVLELSFFDSLVLELNSTFNIFCYLDSV